MVQAVQPGVHQQAGVVDLDLLGFRKSQRLGQTHADVRCTDAMTDGQAECQIGGKRHRPEQVNCADGPAGAGVSLT